MRLLNALALLALLAAAVPGLSLARVCDQEACTDCQDCDDPTHQCPDGAPCCKLMLKAGAEAAPVAHPIPPELLPALPAPTFEPFLILPDAGNALPGCRPPGSPPRDAAPLPLRC